MNNAAGSAKTDEDGSDDESSKKGVPDKNHICYKSQLATCRKRLGCRWISREMLISRLGEHDNKKGNRVASGKKRQSTDLTSTEM